MDKRDVNALNSNEDIPLHMAANSGNETIIRSLVKAGSVVNAVNRDKMTPLHKATIKGHRPGNSLQLLEYLTLN